MKVSADFTAIPSQYAKHAPQEAMVDGVPVVSFPFYIDDIAPEAQYLHWYIVDNDAIEVCGFQWIHWAVANVPIGSLMFDFNDSHALQIPADFSHTMVSMIPEAVQGNTSQASPFVGSKNPLVTQRYNGPQPPQGTHHYQLIIVATVEPLPNISQGFWLNQMLNAFENTASVVDYGRITLLGEA